MENKKKELSMEETNKEYVKFIKKLCKDFKKKWGIPPKEKKFTKAEHFLAYGMMLDEVVKFFNKINFHSENLYYVLLQAQVRREQCAIADKYHNLITNQRRLK